MNVQHPKNSFFHRALLAAFFILMPILGTSAHAADLRLIYSNDNLGELDGCG